MKLLPKSVARVLITSLCTIISRSVSCRPVVAETTALGAAYAAGLATGFWGSEQELRETLARIDAATPGDKKIQIALDEWNDANFGPAPRTPPREFSLARLVQGLIKYADFNQPESDAVFEARMFHAFMRVGDRVPFACRTHIVNSTGAIRASSTDAYVTASGTALQLYGPHSGTKLLKLEQKSPTYDVPAYNWKNIPYLDACAIPLSPRAICGKSPRRVS